MGTSLQEILQSFDRLPDTDKRVFLREVLRRPVALEVGPLTDDELVFAADQLFLVLDEREARDADTQSR